MPISDDIFDHMTPLIDAQKSSFNQSEETEVNKAQEELNNISLALLRFVGYLINRTCSVLANYV